MSGSLPIFESAGGPVPPGAPCAPSRNEEYATGRKGRHQWFVRFGATTIREITQRTASVLGPRGLQHLLLALMAVSLFVLLLAVLAIIFVRVEEPLVLTRCSSPNCRRAARDLEALVDAGVSPCHDFYGHVCRRWTEGAEAAPKEDFAATVVRSEHGVR
ncbi:hypothetical protein V5799_005267 [Amblyomma americanum]|uniref:Uncharacterized protein n=1 Tax=Amblyomma americanum TaxID=6943 RepID=A0AAQ4DZR2_AMBAM